MLRDLVKAQTDVTVSHHTPLGLKMGFKMGPKGHTPVWSEQDLRVNSVEPKSSGQNRPGQAKTKTLGEAEEWGEELNLQAGKRDSPFWRTWFATLAARIIRYRLPVEVCRTRTGQ